MAARFVSSLPAQHVRVFSFTSRLSVAAKRQQVEAAFVLLSRTLVDIRSIPRVERHVLAQVRSPPAAQHWLPARRRAERLEPLLSTRIAPVVEPVVVERDAQHLDLRPRGLAPRLGHAAEDLRPDESREQSD